MKNKTLVTLALTLLVPSAMSAQRKRKPPRPAPVTRTVPVPAPPPQAVAPPIVVLSADLSGRLDGSTYTNNLLGVRVMLPAGWQASDSGVKRQLDERVGQKIGESIQDKPASTQSELRASAARSFSLLLATKATDDTTNPVIIVMAEDISAVPLISSPKQFAASMLRIADAPDSPMVFDAGIDSERVGAVDYAIIKAHPRDLQLAPPGMEQHYYIATRRNHALLFVLTFAGEQQRQACLEVLRAVEYR